MTFPEAVALAALLTDLDWRRDVALGWEETPLYKHAAKAIGEPSYSRWTLLNDPFRGWIRYHRARFEQARLIKAPEHAATPSPGLQMTPGSRNRHFKERA